MRVESGRPRVAVDEHGHELLAAHLDDRRAVVRIDVHPLDLDPLMAERELRRAPRSWTAGSGRAAARWSERASGANLPGVRLRGMAFISRGFQGKRRDEGPEGRVPAGPVPDRGLPRCSPPARRRTRRLDEWTFTIEGGAEPVSLDVGRVPGAAERGRHDVDIHCVTRWSKLDTDWAGRGRRHAARRGRARARRTRSRSATAATRRTSRSRISPTARPGWRTATTASRLDPEHGGPGAAASPAPVLLEERQVGPRPAAPRRGRARLLGANGYNLVRRSVAGTAVLGRLTTGGRPRVDRDRRPRRRASDDHPRRARLAGPPRRPAPGRAADGGGRLPGAAELLDRLAPGDAPTRDHRRGARRRRGLALPRRGARRVTGSRCAARSAAGSCGRRTTAGPLLLVAGGSGVVPLMAMAAAPGRGRERRCRRDCSSRPAPGRT